MSESQTFPGTEQSSTSRRDVLVDLSTGVGQSAQIASRYRKDTGINQTLVPRVVGGMRGVDLLKLKSPREVASAIMLDDPMQRILRDLYTVQSDLMVSDATYEALDTLRSKLTDKAPLR